MFQKFEPGIKIIGFSLHYRTITSMKLICYHRVFRLMNDAEKTRSYNKTLNHSKSETLPAFQHLGAKNATAKLHIPGPKP